MNKLKIVTFGALALLPFLALADLPPATPPNIPGEVQFAQGGIGKIIDLIDTISKLMLYALLTLAGAFIVYAAYLYLTASGDPEKVKGASNVIIYAAVAIAVGLLSRVIVGIARGLVK